MSRSLRRACSVHLPVVALLVSLLGALPNGSQAGTVSAERTMDVFVAPYPVAYRAAGGETNSLTVTTLAGNASRTDVTVTDSTAPISAGAGCRQTSADAGAVTGTVALHGKRSGTHHRHGCC